MVAYGFVFKTLWTMQLKAWRFRILALVCAMPVLASAALGGAPFAAGASAAVDARVARYQPVAMAQGAYRVFALELNNATVLQEFVDASGQVFALRWSGPDLPDMGMLLGPYLPVFKASVQAARQAGKRGGPERRLRGHTSIVASTVGAAAERNFRLRSGHGGASKSKDPSLKNTRHLS